MCRELSYGGDEIDKSLYHLYKAFAFQPFSIPFVTSKCSLSKFLQGLPNAPPVASSKTEYSPWANRQG